jgi:hypothetical protein
MSAQWPQWQREIPDFQRTRACVRTHMPHLVHLAGQHFFSNCFCQFCSKSNGQPLRTLKCEIQCISRKEDKTTISTNKQHAAPRIEWVRGEKSLIGTPMFLFWFGNKFSLKVENQHGASSKGYGKKNVFSGLSCWDPGCQELGLHHLIAIISMYCATIYYTEPWTYKKTKKVVLQDTTCAMHCLSQKLDRTRELRQKERTEFQYQEQMVRSHPTYPTCSENKVRQGQRQSCT